MKKFPDLEQPGTTEINSLPCHIYIDDNSFQISVSGTQDGNTYTVTDSDLETCKKIEVFFDTRNLMPQKDFTIEESAGCVSPKKYPELFE